MALQWLSTSLNGSLRQPISALGTNLDSIRKECGLNLLLDVLGETPGVERPRAFSVPLCQPALDGVVVQQLCLQLLIRPESIREKNFNSFH